MHEAYVQLFNVFPNKKGLDWLSAESRLLKLSGFKPY